MALGDIREGKWRGNWRMEWVASTLHTTSEHGVSSITTTDAQTSAASSRLNWRPCRFKWTHPFHRKTKSGFCACAITFQLVCTYHTGCICPLASAVNTLCYILLHTGSPGKYQHLLVKACNLKFHILKIWCCSPRKQPWNNFIYLFIYLFIDYLSPVGRYVSVTTLLLMSWHATYQVSAMVQVRLYCYWSVGGWLDP